MEDRKIHILLECNRQRYVITVEPDQLGVWLVSGYDPAHPQGWRYVFGSTVEAVVAAFVESYGAETWGYRYNSDAPMDEWELIEKP